MTRRQWINTEGPSDFAWNVTDAIIAAILVGMFAAIVFGS